MEPVDTLLPLLIAPVIGSFLGLLIRHLPCDQSVVGSRSRCEACKHRLTWRQLIPVLSGVLQRGRCRACGVATPGVHLAIELAATAVAAWAALSADSLLWLWLTCGLGWSLLVLAWIDWEHFRLPDSVTLPLLVAGLGATWLLQPNAAPEHAAASAAGFLCLAGLARGYRLLRGRDGLGGGDAKLLGACGAWVGLSALPLVLGAAACFGLLLACLNWLRGRTIGADIIVPFGPGLCLAVWLVWLYAGV